MKRILVVLSVVALMVVMLAMSVAPAFAAWEGNGCRTGDPLVPSAGVLGVDGKSTSDGLICQARHAYGPGGVYVHVSYYDNRL